MIASSRARPPAVAVAREGRRVAREPRRRDAVRRRDARRPPLPRPRPARPRPPGVRGPDERGRRRRHAGPGRRSTRCSALAIRRHCAPLLGLEPHADADTYLDAPAGARPRRGRPADAGGGRHRHLPRRHRLPARRDLLARPRSPALADPGGALPRGPPPRDDGPGAAGRRHRPVASCCTAVGQRLAESEAVGAKSIAAYRCGLDLPGERPRELDVVVALARAPARRRRRLPDRRPRPSSPRSPGPRSTRGLPLQLHVGYGDNDVDLLRCDPLHLTPFLRATAAPRRAGAAAAQLPVPPPRGLPRPGLRPRLHGRRPGGAQHRRPVAAA